ncbi:hypothetical protein ONZ45_g19631 [Pleurotus djamor]|nr:hypothetical protein ONZ45_g19631 [Pleurotus djamor]
MTIETKRYADLKEVRTSYRPKSNLMSPGLKRAREPFRFRNALTGLILAGFAVGVWGYSISAVKQDVFDDIDDEARELTKSGKSADVVSLEDEQKTKNPSAASTTSQIITPSPSLPPTASAPPSIPSTIVTAPQVPLPAIAPRGILAKYLNRRHPWLLDPKQKTLVWGAPPIN